MWGTPSYRSWDNMKKRCLNLNQNKWKSYRDRNITICNKWLKFEGFYEDMGDKPEGKTLDRINNNGNYEIDNCRWATPKQQSNNMVSNRRLNHKGKSLTISQWARALNINNKTLWKRIKKGWTTKEALEIPVGEKRR